MRFRNSLCATGRCLAVALICGVIAAAIVSPTAAQGRKFASMLGVNVKFSQGEPQSDLPKLTELGVKWVRDGVGWPELEPVAGKFVPFPQAFKERLAYYRANGIGIDFLLGYDNQKAYPNSAEKPHNSVDPQAFGRYSVEVAHQLKAAGVRFVLEIWNEPHNFVIAKLLGGKWNGAPPSPWLDHYVLMINEAVKQVKAFDPAIKLMDDDDMWIIHYWLLEQNLPKNLDAISFHPYSGPNGPETAAVSQETDWAKPFTLTDADRSLHSAVRRLREQSHAKLGRAPALWATEWGWKVGDNAPYSVICPNGHVTANTVAAYVPRAFITAADAGVEALLWFSLYDSVDGAMGLIDNNGKPRAAYGAFKTMSHELGEYELVRHLVGSDHRSSGIQAYLFKGASGNMVALWNIDGIGDYLVKTGGPLHVVDLQGTATDVSPKNGVALLHVTQAPCYITGLPDDFALTPAPPTVEVKPVYLMP